MPKMALVSLHKMSSWSQGSLLILRTQFIEACWAKFSAASGDAVVSLAHGINSSNSSCDSRAAV